MDKSIDEMSEMEFVEHLFKLITNSVVPPPVTQPQVNGTGIKENKMSFPKVKQLANNQFTISTIEGEYLQSYDSIIAFVPHNGDPIKLDEFYWNYSVTTRKYRNRFLGENTAETRKKIKSGKYILADLNVR